jgi:hypothetical protein
MSSMTVFEISEKQNKSQLRESHSSIFFGAFLCQTIGFVLRRWNVYLKKIFCYKRELPGWKKIVICYPVNFKIIY